MKIILSVEPIRPPLTGIGRYTLELARNLTQLEIVDELRFFNGSEFLAELPDGVSLTETSTASAMLRFKHQVARLPFVLELYRRALGKAQREMLNGNGEYLYHGPNFYLPDRDGPSVVTIHDLSILKMPEHHPPERVAFMTKEIERAVDRASHVITISEFVRDEIARHFSISRDRITVTHLAVAKEFAPRPEREIAPYLHTLGLIPSGYTLYAGTIEPRKNLERLLSAYEALPVSLRRIYPLVFAGYKGWNNAQIHARIRRGETEGWVRYLGYVAEESLPLLYAGARLFAFPSLYEGFGLPVLEAMASGVPVVCSNVASLPEIAGNAAMTVEPRNIPALSSALEQGLADPHWRAKAIAAGFEQASRFSWKRCAEETAQVYRRTLDQAA